jgi:hypothetical protein
MLAAAAVALVLAVSGSPARLQALDPLTLAPQGPSLRVAEPTFGLVWARSPDGTLALVVKRSESGERIELVSPALRRVRVVPMLGLDVCGLTWRGRSRIVALVGSQPCYWSSTVLSLKTIDTRTGRIVRERAVGLEGGAPAPNVAFGGGRAFVTRAGGLIAAIDLATARLTGHRPRRSLQKGEELVYPHWLGNGRLSVRGHIVDVRTWRARIIESGARGIVRAGDRFVSYGPAGVGIYTRSGRLLGRPLAVPVNVARVVGRFAYAATASGTAIVDLRTRRVVATAGDADVAWNMLAR